MVFLGVGLAVLVGLVWCALRVASDADDRLGGGAVRITLGRPLPDGVGHVSQWFDGNPASYKRFGLYAHNGLDYAAPLGTPVLAAHAGVVQIGMDPGGYGNYVRVVGARLTTIYAHLSVAVVAPGARVAVGDQLGLVGSTGNSTGPHLHFGLKVKGVRSAAYGGWVDPMMGRVED